MGSRWKMKPVEEESIVCETVSHAQGHIHNHTQTDTHACAASVCRECIIRPIGSGAMCVKTYCGPSTTCFNQYWYFYFRGFS